MRHSQYTANPLNPPYQGDCEDFAPVEIIGKCTLISRVYYIYGPANCGPGKMPDLRRDDSEKQHHFHTFFHTPGYSKNILDFIMELG